uniref:Uncharacterized protein n=1 Tax=Anguilla anguilla TaxID=7936 RepID=A0A0E9PW07_ANGAN
MLSFKCFIYFLPLKTWFKSM